jgi:Iap family predicted aminopeptidase
MFYCRFRDSLEREEFGVIVIMEEVEEHMAQLYGEEDAAITATYEQFFQKIVRTRIHVVHFFENYYLLFIFYYFLLIHSKVNAREREVDRNVMVYE